MNTKDSNINNKEEFSKMSINCEKTIHRNSGETIENNRFSTLGFLHI